VRILKVDWDFGRGEGGPSGEGTVTIRFEFIDKLGPDSSVTRINVDLVAERRNRRYLKDQVKARGVVDLSCKE
jgi:hypothetical protein